MADINDELDAQTPATEQAAAAWEATIRASPLLMGAARGLYEAIKAAAPVVAGSVGGPGASAIASIAVGILEKAEANQKR